MGKMRKKKNIVQIDVNAKFGYDLILLFFYK